MAPTENEVDDDVVSPLLPSDYDRDNESDDKDEDTDTSEQQRRKSIQTESIPPTVRNVYNLLLWKKTEYVEENIDQ